MKKAFFFLILLLITFSFFLFVPYPIRAYLLKDTDCDCTDPSYGPPGYTPPPPICEYECDNNVYSQPNIAQWCHHVNWNCVCQEPPEITDHCDCNCDDPDRPIECIWSSECGADSNCIGGICQAPGSSGCNPLLSGADCWLPQGPCSTGYGNTANCIDEDGDGIGECECLTHVSPGSGCSCTWSSSGCTITQSNCPSGKGPVVDTCLGFVVEPIHVGLCWCSCHDCNGNTSEIETALGCINVTSAQGFIKSVLSLALGIGGGIAFLLLLIGAFLILASSGNPDKIKAGKELITSAIAGLLLIIFAVLVLRLIAGNVIQLPGFS